MAKRVRLNDKGPLLEWKYIEMEWDSKINLHKVSSILQLFFEKNKRKISLLSARWYTK